MKTTRDTGKIRYTEKTVNGFTATTPFRLRGEGDLVGYQMALTALEGLLNGQDSCEVVCGTRTIVAKWGR